MGEARGSGSGEKGARDNRVLYIMPMDDVIMREENV